MIIYLTRHGQVCPAVHIGSVDFPKGDIPLTKTGIRQSRCLGNYLKLHKFSGSIISSPYRRTMMTAQEVSMITGCGIYPDGIMREMFFCDEDAADFEGMDLRELKSEFLNVAEDAVLEYPWWTKKADSLEEISMRTKPLIEKLIQNNKGEYLLIGHGASVFATLYYLSIKYRLGFPKDYPAFGSHLATRNLNCNLSVIEIENGVLKAARLFITKHLDEALLSSNTNIVKRPLEYIRP